MNGNGSRSLPRERDRIGVASTDPARIPVIRREDYALYESPNPGMSDLILTVRFRIAANLVGRPLLISLSALTRLSD
jgi:hypothetical protein